MHEIYLPNKQYTLDILLTLISLGANINIDIKNEKSTFSLRNIVMNELIFDIDKFQIVCDGMSLTINDMKDIKLIESASENSISDNISQLQNSLVNYPNEIQDYFKKKIENFKTVNQIFSQEY
jgi:riboflavin synthase alpha subunit